MPELNFALQPSFLALGQSAPASDAGIFKGADLAQRNKDRALQSKQMDAQLARDALSAQLQPLRMREAELKVEDAAADMAWQSTRRELEVEAARTFNEEAPKILSMQQQLDPFGAYKASFDLGIRFPVLSGYKPYQDFMEHAKAGAVLQVNRDKLAELDDYHDGMNQARSRTAAQKDTQALVEAESAARIARGDPPYNPAEQAARTAEVLGGKVTGAKQQSTAKQSDLEYLRMLSDPKESEIFTAMLLGRSGKANNEAQLMRKFAAQEQIRNLKALNLEDSQFDAAVDKILAEYEASLGGESGKPSTGAAKKFKFEFKGDRLQPVQ